MKKIISILTILLVILFTSNVFAVTTSTLKLELVEDKQCNISLNDSGKVTKKLESISDEKKEVVLQVTVENTKQIETQILPSEIFLVIDNSLSMEEEIDTGITREEAVVAGAKGLATKLLQAQPSTKIGVVSFSSLDFSKGESEGTLSDAKLRTLPTNSLNDVLSAIDSIEYTGPRTNIEAGVTIAQQNFSTENNNKALIILTDGVPNNAVGGPTIKYSGEVATKTKAKLKEIKDSGIKIITVMTGVPDVVAPSTSVDNSTPNLTYKQLAQEIFGTEEMPLFGKFYFIQDDEINSTITKSVYKNVIVTKENELKDIKVVDYFPQEIIDNYDFEIIEAANIGSVTSKIDTSNNSITWNIETLSAGEIASFRYKLTLKENFNKEIIDQVMPTNSKVDASFVDIDGSAGSASSPDAPTIVLKQYTTTTPDPEEPEDPTPEPEQPTPQTPTPTPEQPAPTPEKAPTIIPQTGSNLEIGVAVISIILFGSIITSYIYLKKNNY